MIVSFEYQAFSPGEDRNDAVGRGAEAEDYSNDALSLLYVYEITVGIRHQNSLVYSATFCIHVHVEACSHCIKVGASVEVRLARTNTYRAVLIMGYRRLQ